MHSAQTMALANLYGLEVHHQVPRMHLNTTGTSRVSMWRRYNHSADREASPPRPQFTRNYDRRNEVQSQVQALYFINFVTWFYFTKSTF